MAEEGGFVIKSSDFVDNGNIPVKYGFKQENISPQFSWYGAPHEARSFALVMIDYDAQEVVGHSVVHWVVYNIPKDIKSLNVADTRFQMGLNSYNTYGYRGMNPPIKQIHKYYVYLYALNTDTLEFASPPTADFLLAKIHDNIIGVAIMVGSFVQDY